MKRKVKVPRNVSTEWRRFGVPREVSISFWTYVQTEMPGNYENLRMNRDQGGRGFKLKKAYKDNVGNTHLFIILVDDETSPDDLIITDLHHILK